MVFGLGGAVLIRARYLRSSIRADFDKASDAPKLASRRIQERIEAFVLFVALSAGQSIRSRR